jgi:hypothetical protein
VDDVGCWGTLNNRCHQVAGIDLSPEIASYSFLFTVTVRFFLFDGIVCAAGGGREGSQEHPMPGIPRPHARSRQTPINTDAGTDRLLSHV